MLAQSMWGLTLHWLILCGVLCVDLVDGEQDSTSTWSWQMDQNFKYLSEFKNKIVIILKRYSLACVGLIHAKRNKTEIHASVFST
jgi:hypothetical protein